MKRVNCIILLLLILWPASGLHAQSTGILRLTVDRIPATLLIDGDSVEVAYFGNELRAEMWFTLELPAGEHLLQCYATGFQTLEETFTLTGGDTASFEFVLQPQIIIAKPKPVDPVPPGLVRLLITSIPSGATVIVDNQKIDPVTPAVIEREAGEITIETRLDGFQPLSCSQNFVAGKTVSAHFLIRRMPPAVPLAEELGLEYLPTVKKRDERAADRLKKKLQGMAETFAIIPLGQGLLAKMLADDDAQKGANILLISGVTLAVGSWIASRVLPPRKKAAARKWNAEAAKKNKEAAIQNKQIELTIQELYAEAIAQWADENDDRGVVEISEQ